MWYEIIVGSGAQVASAQVSCQYKPKAYSSSRLYGSVVPVSLSAGPYFPKSLNQGPQSGQADVRIELMHDGLCSLECQDLPPFTERVCKFSEQGFGGE